MNVYPFYLLPGKTLYPRVHSMRPYPNFTAHFTGYLPGNYLVFTQMEAPTFHTQMEYVWIDSRCPQHPNPSNVSL
eukprot:scaffold51377_cov44-Cyclotella_meneghiniana.AAC.1